MATKTKRRPGRPKRPRQQFLPGMAPPSIKAIDLAAENYVDARDERMELTGKEVDAHAHLLSLMREHGLESYTFDEYEVTLDSKTKVKVRRKRDPEANGEE